MQILQLALSALLLGGQGPNPNSQFDWTIPAGETFVFNTVSQVIVSSPPQFQQTAVNGFVDVRNFTIEEGGILIIQGPNPMVLCAGGQVVIEGRLSIDGTSSPGVFSTNSTSSPEPGAPGQGGGGAGGTGSPFATMSSPQGGSGRGAFDVPGGGGQGGETGWAITTSTPGQTQAHGTETMPEVMRRKLAKHEDENREDIGVIMDAMKNRLPLWATMLIAGLFAALGYTIPH